jgi:oxygen-independent coproporphyrinogen-3 oxidase
MDADLITKYDRPTPRYTSYPTAPHFHADINAEVYRAWLRESDPDRPVSLYLHVPYCGQMCWYCGCHTKITARYEPIAAFVDLLIAEIDLVADLLQEGGQVPRRVAQLHWGGGTPNALAPDDLRRVMRHLASRFDFLPAGERAIELDPRWFSSDLIRALKEGGFNRASLGVQDFDARVQLAINRLQPVDLVRQAVRELRGIGIGSINFDLIYGLPHQTVDSLTNSIRVAAELRPERLSLFGYAHVPWLKPNQRMIDEASLPDAGARWQLYQAAVAEITARGYVAVGLDHFARPDDDLAVAAGQGLLKRNFQGYTTDDAPLLIGLGPSAIGTLPQGYVQNETGINGWSQAVQAGRLPIARGVAVDGEDLLRRAVIERLMCDGVVDLDDVAAALDVEPDHFDEDLARLAPLVEDGLATVDGSRIAMTPQGRPLVRVAAACFDLYLLRAMQPGIRRHSRAV